MHDIAANLARIHERIAAAAQQAGRNAGDIKLIAVSKTHSVEAIAAAVSAGQRAFGESTTQEALQKIPLLAQSSAEWHFIGHLQSNKAKLIPGNFHWLHSLDDIKLAQRLARLTQPERAPLNTLIEVNVTGDPAKHGIAPEKLFPLLDELLREQLNTIALRGLMTIAPHGVSVSEIRAVFASLRRMRDDAMARYTLPGFTELSMGMSEDFEDAIREGATFIRVGTAIFGNRDY
ncbi:MAG TPA: YggS family pyridoxal phosphate-dependent enzyme [Burkholderiales bacterium]|nr:YggS family pyridoxal phosphate-dependent enzyme [Burkholderiales bacterium]